MKVFFHFIYISLDLYMQEDLPYEGLSFATVALTGFVVETKLRNFSQPNDY